jgi:hypothetical protein
MAVVPATIAVGKSAALTSAEGSVKADIVV